jgi:Domain of unknown function (DUF4136)
MYSSFRLVRFSAVAIMALSLTGCASMRVMSYVDTGADFTRYQTYNWAPASALSTGDPRLDNNPFFQERVQADIESNLATRGFEKVTLDAPDLLIHYHASVTQRVDVNAVARQRGYCDAGDCQPYVDEKGTLVVDFVDRRTNRLVWRGWAEGAVDGVIDHQQWLEQRIDDAVMRILKRLPSDLRNRR